MRRNRVTLYGLLRRDGEPRAAAAWTALCARLTGTHQALRAALLAPAVWNDQRVREPCGTCGKPHFPWYCDLCAGHACADHECEWDDDDDDPAAVEARVMRALGARPVDDETEEN